MNKQDQERLAEHLLQPVSDEELFAYVYLLVRVCATERSRYWGRPGPSSDSEWIWLENNNVWTMEVVYGSSYAVFAWRHVDIHVEPEYKLFLFRQGKQVARAVVAARSENAYSRGWWRVIYGNFIEREAFMCNIKNRAMQADDLAAVSALPDSRPRRTLSRIEFADEFGLILPGRLTAQARRIVGV